jgi:hypothetical protein
LLLMVVVVCCCRARQYKRNSKYKRLCHTVDRTDINNSKYTVLVL